MKKRTIAFFILCITFSFSVFANKEAISIQHIGNHGHHSGLPIWPADEPTVYYDDVEMVITIDGSWSESGYYDVEIISMSTLDTELSTRVTSTDNTIDVSSLPEDSYKIIITSSIGNTYQGVFTDGVPGKK
jgi:hypothetical protein